MCKDFGLLSGKYDSTKQRAVLLQGDRLRNYRRYNATIRMEMLIAGGITVTDAQFYDGLYFAWMTEDGDQFNEFLECVSNFSKKCKDRKIFKVMQRKENYDALATNMFCKQFFFSSLESKELANFVNEVGEDYETTCSDKSIEATKEPAKESVMLRIKETELSKYLENMKVSIACTYKNIYKEEWEQFSKRITKLFKGISDKKLYEVWRQKEDNGYRDFKYKDFLSEYFDDNLTYQDKMNDLLTQFENLMEDVNLSKKYFVSIRKQALEKYPTRSTIVNCFNKIFRLASGNLNNKNFGRAENLRLEYIKLFNDRYNKAIAYQHHAKFLDVCDYNDKVKDIVNNKIDRSKIYNIPISADMIKKMGTMTWKEYYKIISDSEIIDSYNNLCSSYDNERIDCTTFSTSVSDYIALINDKINQMNINDSTDVNQGPWNYYNTNRYQLYKKFFSELSPPSFIGGGSYIEGVEANEICLFRNCGDKSIYRLKICTSDSKNINDYDDNYDTVIAPVKNIFNGNGGS